MTPQGLVSERSAALDPSGAAARPLHRRLALLGLVVSVATVVLTLLVPVAPVAVQDTVVTWPRDGEQTRSAVALLSPYRPLDVDVRFTCAAVQAVERVGTGARTVVSTLPPTDPRASTDGLLVKVEGGRMQVVAGSRVVFEESPPAACTYELTADGRTLEVRRDDAVLARVDAPSPHVSVLTTEDGAGLGEDDLRVRAIADDDFVARPTAIKLLLLVVALLGALVSVVMLVLAERGRRRPAPATDSTRRRAGPRVADGPVVVVLVLWWLIGPVSADDGWYTVMARNADEAGYIGNYYRWFNAPEAPFGTSQRLFEALSSWTVEPLWLRAPAMVAGVLTWLLLSRSLLPAGLRTTRVQLLAGLCFLLWWLPFNLTTRPEPFVALAFAASFALVARAVRTDRTPELAAAAVVAALSITMAPVGIAAAVPFVVFGRPLLLLLTRRSRLESAAIVASAAAAATVGLLVVFWNQSLDTVVRATRLHQDIGPYFQWYEEVERYYGLLTTGEVGNYARRAPVLITLVLLAAAAYLLTRQRGRRPPAQADDALRRLALATAFGLLALWPLPSKIPYHFGALAPVAATLIAVVVHALWTERDPGTQVAGWLVAGSVAVASALSLTGPNTWWQYSNLGQSWSGLPPEPNGIRLGSLSLWLMLTLGVAGALVLLARRRSGRAWSAVHGAAMWRTSAVTATLAMSLVVALMVSSFALATLRMRDSWSFGKANLQTLTSSSCGIPDAVVADRSAPGDVLVASEDSATDGTGFTSDQGSFANTPPPVWSKYVWGSFPDSVQGTFTSPWFPVPTLAASDSLYVSVAGRIDGLTSLQLEVRTPSGTSSQPVVDTGDSPSWRSVRVVDGRALESADAVRLIADDASVGQGGWFAFTGPRVAHTEPLGDVIAAGPVFVDWPIALATPCARLATVADGLVQPPQFMLVRADADSALAGEAVVEWLGGSFFGLTSAATFSEIPTSMPGTEPFTWGRLYEVDYLGDPDAVRVEHRTRTMPGTG